MIAHSFPTVAPCTRPTYLSTPQGRVQDDHEAARQLHWPTGQNFEVCVYFVLRGGVHETIRGIVSVTPIVGIQVIVRKANTIV